MKIRNLIKNFPLLLLAFLNASCSQAYSYNTDFPNLDPRNYDYLQEGQNTDACLFNEISSWSQVQIVTEKDRFTGSELISCKSWFRKISIEDKKVNSIFFRDKKDLLNTYIFPFHFFW